ncbi:MAG: hypothetical protein LC687_04255 [Actinobacteria bacterium]|nr:hypothetical protein [Actinomycetota bacterium]
MQEAITKAVRKPLAEVASKLQELAKRAGFLVVLVGLGGLGCTPGFFRLSADAWVAEAECVGTLSPELLESTGMGFEDLRVFRLRADDLPQGKDFRLQLRKADGYVAEDLGTVFVGEGGVIQSDGDGKAIDVVLRFSKMLQHEPVGQG